MNQTIITRFLSPLGRAFGSTPLALFYYLLLLPTPVYTLGQLIVGLRTYELRAAVDAIIWTLFSQVLTSTSIFLGVWAALSWEGVPLTASFVGAFFLLVLGYLSEVANWFSERPKKAEELGRAGVLERGTSGLYLTCRRIHLNGLSAHYSQEAFGAGILLRYGYIEPGGVALEVKGPHGDILASSPQGTTLVPEPWKHVFSPTFNPEETSSWELTLVNRGRYTFLLTNRRDSPTEVVLVFRSEKLSQKA